MAEACSGAPLKIAFFFADLSGGGVEKMRLHLAREFLRRGYEVSLILGRLTGALAHAIPDGVQVINLNAARTRNCILPLASHLRAANPDILFASLPHNNIAAAIARVIAANRTKLVLCQHNALSLESRANWRYRLIPVLYRLLSWRASAFVAVSDGVADDLASIAHIARHKIFTIYNPVLAPHARHDYPGPPPHPWYFESPPPLIFVGRLEEQKNPLLALHALEYVKNPRQRLIFLGEGSLDAALAREISAQSLQDRVLLAGYAPNPLPWIYYARALIVASRFEGFSNVIAEALACATPVISTKCNFGPSEILQNGTHGTLIPPGNPQALGTAINDLAHQRWNRNRLRARGREFTVEKSADLYEKLLHRLRTPNHAFGCSLSPLNAQEIADLILTSSPAGDAAGIVVTPNIDHIRLLKNLDFAAAYRRATIITADGAPIAAYARLRLRRKIPRATGCDIIAALFRHPQFAQKRIFIVADCAATAATIRAFTASRATPPQIEVAIAPQKFLANPCAQTEMLRAITSHRSEILILTLGAPTSEIFADTHRTALAGCWSLCVGQAVKVQLGLVKRAPPSLRALGLEFLWRITQDPLRLLPRYLRAAWAMPGAILQDLF